MSDTTTMRARAWFAGLPTSSIVLIASNLVPLVGVLFLGWDLQTILVLYWVESGVIGLLNVPKMLIARGPIVVQRGAMSLALPDVTGGAGLLARVALSVFFIVHYGIFWLVHGFFVFLIPTFAAAGAGQLELTNASGPFPTAGLDLGVIAPAAGLLLVSHLVSFAVNYIGRGEYMRVSPIQQMVAPYSRVVVMHLTILGGGVLASLLGAPEWTLVVMVVAKIVVDLRLHARERTTAAQRPLLANPSTA